MKVAVISAGRMSGKTTFIQMLAGVYSRSQQKEVIVLSSGNAVDNLELVSNVAKISSLDNPHVIKSLVCESEITIDEIVNYGVRAGDEHVYIYDILNCAMSDRDKIEFLMNMITNVPASLTLVEICGDIRNPINVEIMKKCDCALIFTDCSQKGIRELSELMNNMPDIPIKTNRGFVLGKYDKSVCSTKKYCELSGVSPKELFIFPYNSQLPKMSFTGQLDRLPYKVVNGEFEVTEFRTSLYAIMSFIFDTADRKIIRSIDRWFK